MKKILFVILLCGVMALGLAGCSNLVSDSKKELEDAKNDLEETYKKYGWVEKETVNTILAKFNTEIMDGGLNTPASDDYMVVDNGKYWFALTDDVAFYLKPVESSGNKEKDILDMSAIYMDNDKYDETTAIKYTKLLIKANNEEITDSEIDELLKEAKEKSSSKETANNETTKSTIDILIKKLNPS